MVYVPLQVCVTHSSYLLLKPIEGCPEWAGGSIDYHNMSPCHVPLTEQSVHRPPQSYTPPRQPPSTLIESDPLQRDGPGSTPRPRQASLFPERPQSPAISNLPEGIRSRPCCSFATVESQTARAERGHQSLRGMRRNPSTRQPIDPTLTRTTPPPSVTLAPAERQHIRFQLELVDIEVAALLSKRKQLLALLSK